MFVNLNPVHVPIRVIHVSYIMNSKTTEVSQIRTNALVLKFGILISPDVCHNVYSNHDFFYCTQSVFVNLNLVHGLGSKYNYKLLYSVF